MTRILTQPLFNFYTHHLLFSCLNRAYSNFERTNITLGNPVMIQTINHSFVVIPSMLSQTKSNSDILVGTMGLHYGLTGKTDIYGNVSYLVGTVHFNKKDVQLSGCPA